MLDARDGSVEVDARHDHLTLLHFSIVLAQRLLEFISWPQFSLRRGKMSISKVVPFMSGAFAGWRDWKYFSTFRSTAQDTAKTEFWTISPIVLKLVTLKVMSDLLSS